jgi:PPOX class probable F420-dependent enzyme
MKIPQELRDLIESGTDAHLVTMNKDGSPHVTIVWIGLDGDEIVSAHLPRNQKVRNIERDSRVVISLEASTKSELGLTEYAVIYGEARITEGGAAELLQKLAHVYIRPGVKFPPMDNPPPGYITRIQVTRIEGVGPWVNVTSD